MARAVATGERDGCAFAIDDVITWNCRRDPVSRSRSMMQARRSSANAAY
jgi:hypothetical protein